MAICGIVIDLDRDQELRHQALAALAADPRVEVGEASGPRLPAVTETATGRDDRDLWDWIGSLPGVRQVQLACAHFDDGTWDDDLEAVDGDPVEDK